MVKVNIVECIYFKFCSTFKRKKIFKTKSEYRHIKQSNFDFNIALVLAKIRCVVRNCSQKLTSYKIKTNLVLKVDKSFIIHSKKKHKKIVKNTFKKIRT